MASQTDFSKDPAHPLSARELAVLRELTKGLGNQEIARTLGITGAAVHVHLRSLLTKIGAQTRAEAAIWGAENDIGEAGFGEGGQTV